MNQLVYLVLMENILYLICKIQYQENSLKRKEIFHLKLILKLLVLVIIITILNLAYDCLFYFFII